MRNGVLDGDGTVLCVLCAIAAESLCVDLFCPYRIARLDKNVVAGYESDYGQSTDLSYTYNSVNFPDCHLGQ